MARKSLLPRLFIAYWALALMLNMNVIAVSRAASAALPLSSLEPIPDFSRKILGGSIIKAFSA
jgi:hypothetical protein